MTRAKRIIAVFGGSSAPGADVLDCARALGHEIARAGHILLTGGTESDSHSVKGCAIEGAMPGPWIGIGQKGPVEGKPTAQGGFVIRTGLDNKRNFVEAFICDAAVALPGKEGTVSEVVCSLSLYKAVALAGSMRTKIDLEPTRRVKSLGEAVETTRRLFGEPSGIDALDALLSADALNTALRDLPPYTYFEPRDAQSVVRWIESAVAGPDAFKGEFPLFALNADVKLAYEEWLANHAS